MEHNSEVNEDPNVCIWKAPLKRKKGDKIELVKFPCRYPEKEKTTDVCVPCLLGEMFTVNYTQMVALKEQQGLNEEVMTFLRNLTSDGSMDDLR